MIPLNPLARIVVPDGLPGPDALRRTTHLGIGAQLLQEIGVIAAGVFHRPGLHGIALHEFVGARAPEADLHR